MEESKCESNREFVNTDADTKTYDCHASGSS